MYKCGKDSICKAGKSANSADPYFECLSFDKHGNVSLIRGTSVNGHVVGEGGRAMIPTLADALREAFQEIKNNKNSAASPETITRLEAIFEDADRYIAKNSVNGAPAVGKA